MNPWRLVSDVSRLVQSWWQQDRIRVSPREGRLLALKPSCILLLDGERAEVKAIRHGQWLGRPRIMYECATRNGPAQLEVRLDASAVWRIRWRDRHGVRPLQEEDIEVFDPTGCPSA